MTSEIITSTTSERSARRRAAVVAEQVVTLAVVLTMQSYALPKVIGANAYVALVGSITVLVYAVAGVLMLGDPTQRGNGRLLTVAAVLSAVVIVPGEPADGSWGPTIGAVHNSTVVLLGWLLLRYPHPRLPDRASRLLVACAAVWIPLTELALVQGPLPWPTLLGHGNPERWFGVDAGELNESLYGWAYTGRQLLCLVFVVLLGRRLRRARGGYRRTLAPVLVPGIVLGLIPIVEPMLGLVRDDEGFQVRYFLICLLLLALAAALAVAATRRRLAAAPVAELLAVLGQRDADVRDALRRTLADPDLQVYFRVGATTATPGSAPEVPAGSGYVDRDGNQTVPAVRPGRSLVAVADADGRPLAVVSVSASVLAEPTLLDAALRASALALENERLHAEVLAQLAEVRASRARIVAAGVAERRAVERDLHDGAQQRMLALSTTLSRLRATADDPATRELVEQARAELRESLAELRDLARGIHPAVLTQIGLRAAVESVAERLPIEVALDMADVRLPEAVETTIYYVVCEALTNVVKHSGATRAEVSISTPGPLTVRIADNGVGVDVPEGVVRGSLGDRVRALGGELSVSTLDSSAGGTVVEARLPVESTNPAPVNDSGVYRHGGTPPV